MHSEIGPVIETKPNPENCKNCSSKCAYDCAQLQYTVQHAVLIISPLTSRQSRDECQVSLKSLHQVKRYCVTWITAGRPDGQPKTGRSPPTVKGGGMQNSGCFG